MVILYFFLILRCFASPIQPMSYEITDTTQTTKLYPIQVVNRGRYIFLTTKGSFYLK